MTTTIGILCLTAVTIGTIHTLIGPDHYIPFVAMSRSGKWSRRKTFLVTLGCGIGHVASSILIGLVGIGLGVALDRLESVEGARANVAGWLMLGFGIFYMISGLVSALRSNPHQHWHSHADGTVHVHEHRHDTDHLHVHATDGKSSRKRPSVVGPWALFLLFLFGPCEPLIPLLMYPAAEANWLAVAAVTVLFSLATLTTMLTVVLVLTFRVPFVERFSIERYSHALAGFAITLCGCAIKLGW